MLYCALALLYPIKRSRLRDHIRSSHRLAPKINEMIKNMRQTPPSYLYGVPEALQRNPWKSGIFRRLPWLGISAFLGALLGIGAAIAILIASNGKPTADWSVQPTVYLAIASAVTNILLHFALAEAVNVAWWSRASQTTTKVADLHRTWIYGNSLWAAVRSGRHVNKVAIACMLLALGPINGPLLQRASRVTLGEFRREANIEFTVAQALPNGYTGYLSGRGVNVALLTPKFTRVVVQDSTQAPINITSTGCIGQCSARIKAAGFAVNCSDSTDPYTLTPKIPAAGESYDVTQPATQKGTLAFLTTFYWNTRNPGALNMRVQFKPTSACDGSLTIRKCDLTAARVSYPVILNGNRSTIALAPSSTIFDDQVLNADEDIIREPDSGPTTYGGLYKYLLDSYNSTANLYFAGARGYDLHTTGATSNRYALLSDDVTPEQGSLGPTSSCTLFFSDPSNDLLQAVRELMFRTAILAANASTPPQRVMAQETVTLPVYNTQYLYMGLAVLCTMLGWLAVFPVWNGWWSVGRATSMSPIETAKAFRAPMLEGSDSNADADMLLKEVGDRELRYGAVTMYGGREQRLEMNKPQFVTPPEEGMRFDG